MATGERVRDRSHTVQRIVLLTKPVVDPEIGKEVPDEHVLPAEILAKSEQDGSNNGEAKIAEKNELGILGLVKRRIRVEMIDTATEAILPVLAAAFRLTLVEVVTGDVGKQVQRPSDQLLADQVDHGSDGSLLGQLVKLVGESTDARGVDLAGLGHEDHVTLEMTGGLVMLAVGNLPGEVRHQERRVEDPANGVV